MKVIKIDVETTGVNPKTDRIIELAAIFNDDVFYRYCIPFPVKPEGFEKIEELTGIEWEKLQACGVDDKTLYSEFVSWLSGIIDKFDRVDKAVLFGYNVKFDSDFIRELFTRNGNSYYGSYFVPPVLDVMSEVAACLADGLMPPLQNYKLKTVCDHFGIEFTAHSALDDIMATDELYKKISDLRKKC